MFDRKIIREHFIIVHPINKKYTIYKIFYLPKIEKLFLSEVLMLTFTKKCICACQALDNKHQHFTFKFLLC